VLQDFRFAPRPDDTDEVLLEKRVIFLVASSCVICGIVWTLMYAVLFGWGLIAFWPGLFVLVVGSAMAVAHAARNHHVAVYAQIICIMYLTAAIQWSIGSIFDSGIVILWSFIGPVAALIFFSPRASLGWFGLFLINIIVTVVFDEKISEWGPGTSPVVRRWFFLMNMGIGSAVVFAFAGFFMVSATRERNRAEGLLLNILPRQIAPRLKRGEKTIADQYDSASVLFADMVGSTPLFSGMSAHETVAWLNEVFTLFDRLIEKHDLEKIRLVAGVIGETKFQYDLWGDTVNTAARMESHGEVGRLQVSADTHALIKDTFVCVSRGVRAIKGKGEMETYFVEGKKGA
jgi:guanylate cyclase